MKTYYDENVIDWFPLRSENVMCKIEDHDGGDDDGYSKKANSQPCQFGSFFLSHPKRTMNDVIFSFVGFKNFENNYSDTYSIYIYIETVTNT